MLYRALSLALLVLCSVGVYQLNIAIAQAHASGWHHFLAIIPAMVGWQRAFDFTIDAWGLK